MNLMWNFGVKSGSGGFSEMVKKSLVMDGWRNYKRYLIQLVMIVISCSLLACAATEEEPDGAGETARNRGSDCISQMSVRDYRVLDDSNLIVSESGKRKYHVVLQRRAFGLRSSWKLGFRSTTSRVCAGFGEIIVDDGMGPDRIRIASIRRLTPEDEEDLLIRFGKIKPENPQTPAPEKVEGAEVEELD
ncbi:MAG: hypothetical protein HKN55_07030 [Woeseiaceae bacterium]|nr:hypothetical protein [Woeseiaceae bacterium]